jgi:hypothetical protein
MPSPEETAVRSRALAVEADDIGNFEVLRYRAMELVRGDIV